IHLDILEKWLGVLLRAATLILGMAVAAGLAFLVWNAARSNELIIDAFSVPPDLAQKGVSGEVLAGEVVDRLVEIQEGITTFRAPQTYANTFGESVKLEIPDTGISLAELDRFLREKLGNNTHISGALVRTAAGLKLTARIGGVGSDSVEGAESDLDMLVQRAADAIYNRTQPFRYATHIWQQGHNAEAHQLFVELARSESPAEQAWAYLSLGATATDTSLSTVSDTAVDANIRFTARATQLDPGNALAWSSYGLYREYQGWDEDALAATKKALALVSGEGHGKIRADYALSFRKAVQARLDAGLGAFDAAAKEQVEFVALGKIGMTPGNSANAALYQAFAHDITAARATMADPMPDNPGRIALGNVLKARARILIAQSAQDWAGVLREMAALGPQFPGLRSRYFPKALSAVAIAEARLGRFAQAEARISNMPADCYRCLIARAQIAALQGQQARADWWFDRAAKAGPSMPFAQAEWGQALLARGDLDGAIAKFVLANQKGPNFADPLEGWGEALMAKNQSHRALAKFSEAAKYAPNWGRLHLKWGEALFYAGKRSEARKQFARAAQLDLTPSEKSELAGQK
ncbi:MAG TPA: hypothetical protein VN175_13730, partial [Rhizomicrobium sp.]|nr:hypothetical protein [Rhizomicrobium sp.]